MLDLAAQRDPERALHHAIESALALCGGDSGALYLTLPSGQLELRYAVGATLDEAGFRSEQGEGVAGAVVSSGSAQLVSDCADFAGRYAGQQRSIICAPLHSNDRVIGAMTLITEKRTDAYSVSDLSVLERFALLISVILDRAQLNRKLQSDAEAQRTPGSHPAHHRTGIARARSARCLARTDAWLRAIVWLHRWGVPRQGRPDARGAMGRFAGIQEIKSAD